MKPQDTTEYISPALHHTESPSMSQTETQDSTCIQQEDSVCPLIGQKTSTHTEYISTNYDSIMQHRELSNIDTSNIYISGREMPDRDVANIPQRYSFGNDNYIAVSMLVMFALIAVIIYSSGTFLAYRIKDLFTNKRKYTDENTRASTSEARNTLILSSISSLSVCLILFSKTFCQEWQDIDQTSVYTILSIGFLVLMAFIFIKALVYIFINWIFFHSAQGHKWISSYFLITSVSAFILFPLALIEIYSEYKLPQTGFSLLLVFILYELLLFYKLCANFRTKKHGIPLIFLYFCSVEIMPTFVLWHIFNGVNESFIVKI